MLKFITFQDFRKGKNVLWVRTCINQCGEKVTSAQFAKSMLKLTSKINDYTYVKKL